MKKGHIKHLLVVIILVRSANFHSSTDYHFCDLQLTRELIALATVASLLQFSRIDRPSFDCCPMNSSLGAAVVNVDGRSFPLVSMSHCLLHTLSYTNSLHLTAPGQFIREPANKFPPGLLVSVKRSFPLLVARLKYSLCLWKVGQYPSLLIGNNGVHLLKRELNQCTVRGFVTLHTWSLCLM
jgi:hypothetical protein